MKFLKAAALTIVLAASFTASAFAAVTQTATNNDYNTFNYGGAYSFMSIDLAAGTTNVSALTTSVTTVDQGWGGQCDCNQVFVGLVDANNNILWGDHVAGSTHAWSTYNFDLTNDLVGMTNLNALLASYDYSNGNTARLQLFGNNIGWGGWQLFVNGASMSVTSSASNVPEPGSVALLGLGLVGFMASRRKAAAK
jgi:hypothetical protein